MHNPENGAKGFGFEGPGAVFWNLTEAALYERSIARGEARLTAHGALAAETGEHTGRSPKDRFIVRDEGTEDEVWWDNNPGIGREAFDLLKEDMIAYASTRSLFAQDLYGGADPAHRISVRVYAEYAWHGLFIRTMLRRPERDELADFAPEMTIVCLPGFKADPERHGTRSQTAILCDFTRGVVLICGTAYAGEMKKSVFSYLNYLLPAGGVMPMHCSANVGEAGDSALFFGLSGTGKTTLSAEASRTLIGDDEHGWSAEGIFNFEGGCYAKTIRLSAAAEPEIFAATQRFGTVLENVVINPDTRLPDFDDGSLAENARAAYPLHFIPNASTSSRAGAPKNIFMLTCDAFGVMPPIARLTPAQAMYHFLSGYTAKVAGTETGVTEPQATFSTCFGAPFMPRHPSVYGNLLRDLITRHEVDCWLINTGWTGGAFGTGRRMPIGVTRRLLAAAFDGSLKEADFRTDPYFGFAVPTSIPGVEPHILYPAKTWANAAAFDATARKLVGMFTENFARFEAEVDEEVREARPQAMQAAE
ncbi:phosphoenolpyruvate carboxykinase [Bosea sp. 117]|uniref:phosphoenolpyruvate carboxykinase n=1 Tax=Bosea sp. 117 TaxID=1125973 RepID=UPI0020BE5A5B|nr:phosphoenolpyruvate carboxykinase [Bosea sp. 117]